MNRPRRRSLTPHMIWTSDTEFERGEPTTRQASLDEVVNDYEPVPRKTRWAVGLRAGLKALVILTTGMVGMFYLMHTDTFHVAMATGISTAILMEVFGIADFLKEL